MKLLKYFNLELEQFFSKRYFVFLKLEFVCIIFFEIWNKYSVFINTMSTVEIMSVDSPDLVRKIKIQNQLELP